MDARARLRAYLEQRRELGETEFVLDGMSVEDALAAIDKLRPRGRTGQVNGARVRPARTPERPASHGASAAAPTTPASRPSHEAPAHPEPAAPDVQYRAPVRPDTTAVNQGLDDAMTNARQGIVVGNANGTLFEQNPFHSERTLGALAKLIEDCTRCQLYRTAKNPVPGEGDPHADFMCVGEAPGANEDETGRPFVGQAGGLLTRILAAIDLTREQVFITNVLKHRPPGNRNPQPSEVQACGPYLVRQIQMVKPKVILALGTFAAQTLLETKTPIGKLRGAIHRYYGVPVIVTYHPAALLRNPAWKRPTWEDVKLARHVLDSAQS